MIYLALSYHALKGATSGYGLMASLAALLIPLTNALGLGVDGLNVAEIAQQNTTMCRLPSALFKN